MTSELLARIVAFEAWLFTLGLLGLVFHQMATGRINVRGLIRVKRPGQHRLDPSRVARANISPTRVQLLMLTLAGAFAYIALLPDAGPGSLPDVPRELLLLFGGSASIYIGGKSTPLVTAMLPLRDPSRSDQPKPNQEPDAG